MRYVVYGAGAIGGTIGALLHASGREVTLIARGPHLEAMRAEGLRFETPERSQVVRVTVARSAAEAGVGPGDVVVLAMKTQDTGTAVDELVTAAGPQVRVLCAQNGVENERLALRRVRDVYGALVLMPAEHLAPGVVRAYSAPVAGVLDVGRYPEGADELARTVSADFEAAGLGSRPHERVMRLKYAKLLGNLANAAEVVCGSDERRMAELAERAREEGVACLAAAGIEHAGAAEMGERNRLLSARPVAGEERRGGSSWQSAVRATGRVEADWLNGEIALLGRLHGIATPVNETLQRLANRVARERLEPGSLPASEVDAALAAAGA